MANVEAAINVVVKGTNAVNRLINDVAQLQGLMGRIENRPINVSVGDARREINANLAALENYANEVRRLGAQERSLVRSNAREAGQLQQRIGELNAERARFVAEAERLQGQLNRRIAAGNLRPENNSDTYRRLTSGIAAATAAAAGLESQARETEQSIERLGDRVSELQQQSARLTRQRIGAAVQLVDSREALRSADAVSQLAREFNRYADSLRATPSETSAARRIPDQVREFRNLSQQIERSSRQLAQMRAELAALSTIEINIPIEITENETAAQAAAREAARITRERQQELRNTISATEAELRGLETQAAAAERRVTASQAAYSRALDRRDTPSGFSVSLNQIQAQAEALALVANNSEIASSEFNRFTVAAQAAAVKLARSQQQSFAALAAGFSSQAGVVPTGLGRSETAGSRSLVAQAIADIPSLTRSEAALSQHISLLTQLKSIVPFLGDEYTVLSDSIERLNNELQDAQRLGAERGAGAGAARLTGRTVAQQEAARAQGPISLLPQFSIESDAKRLQFNQKLEDSFREQVRLSEKIESSSLDLVDKQRLRLQAERAYDTLADTSDVNRIQNSKKIVAGIKDEITNLADAARARKRISAEEQTVSALTQRLSQARGRVEASVGTGLLSEEQGRSLAENVASAQAAVDERRLKLAAALTGEIERQRVSGERVNRASVLAADQTERSLEKILRLFNEISNSSIDIGKKDVLKESVREAFTALQDESSATPIRDAERILDRVRTEFSDVKGKAAFDKRVAKAQSDLDKALKDFDAASQRLEAFDARQAFSSAVEAEVSGLNAILSGTETASAARAADKDFKERLQAASDFRTTLLDLQKLEKSYQIQAGRGVEADQEREKLTRLIQANSGDIVDKSRSNVEAMKLGLNLYRKSLDLRVLEAKLADQYQTPVSQERIDFAKSNVLSKALDVQKRIGGLEALGIDPGSLQSEIDQVINGITGMGDAGITEVGRAAKQVLDISNKVKEVSLEGSTSIKAGRVDTAITNAQRSSETLLSRLLALKQRGVQVDEEEQKIRAATSQIDKSTLRKSVTSLDTLLQANSSASSLIRSKKEILDSTLKESQIAEKIKNSLTDIETLQKNYLIEQGKGVSNSAEKLKLDRELSGLQSAQLSPTLENLNLVRNTLSEYRSLLSLRTADAKLAGQYGEGKTQEEIEKSRNSELNRAITLLSEINKLKKLGLDLSMEEQEATNALNNLKTIGNTATEQEVNQQAEIIRRTSTSIRERKLGEELKPPSVEQIEKARVSSLQDAIKARESLLRLDLAGIDVAQEELRLRDSIESLVGLKGTSELAQVTAVGNEIKQMQQMAVELEAELPAGAMKGIDKLQAKLDDAIALSGRLGSELSQLGQVASIDFSSEIQKLQDAVSAAGGEGRTGYAPALKSLESVSRANELASFTLKNQKEEIKNYKEIESYLAKLQTLQNNYGIEEKKGVAFGEEKLNLQSQVNNLSLDSIGINRTNVDALKQLVGSYKDYLDLRISEAKLAGTYKPGKTSTGLDTPEKIEKARSQLLGRALSIQGQFTKLESEGASITNEKLQAETAILRLKELQGKATKDEVELIAQQLLDISNIGKEIKNAMPGRRTSEFEAALPRAEAIKRYNEIISDLNAVAPGADLGEDNIVSSFIDNLKSGASSAVAAATQFAEAAKKAIEETFDTANPGDNIVSTFAHSLKDGASSAAAAATAFTEAGKKAIKKALGISSPSKFILIEIVGNIVSTWQDGLARSAGKIRAAFEKAFTLGQLDFSDIQKLPASVVTPRAEPTDTSERLAAFTARTSSNPSFYRKLAAIIGGEIVSSPAITEATYRKTYERGGIVSPTLLPVEGRRFLRGTPGIPGSGLEPALFGGAIGAASRTGAFVDPIASPRRLTTGVSSAFNPAIAGSMRPSVSVGAPAGLFDVQAKQAQAAIGSVYSMVGKSTFKDFSARASKITAASIPTALDDLKQSLSILGADLSSKVKSIKVSAADSIEKIGAFADDIASLGRAFSGGPEINRQDALNDVLAAPELSAQPKSGPALGTAQIFDYWFEAVADRKALDKEIKKSLSGPGTEQLSSLVDFWATASEQSAKLVEEVMARGGAEQRDKLAEELSRGGFSGGGDIPELDRMMSALEEARNPPDPFNAFDAASAYREKVRDSLNSTASDISSGITDAADTAVSEGESEVKSAIRKLFDRISESIRKALPGAGGGAGGGRGPGGLGGASSDPSGPVNQTSEAMRRLGDVSKMTNNQLEITEKKLTDLRNGLDATGDEFRRITDDLARIGREQERRDPNADFLTRRFGPRAAAGISEGLIGGAFPLLFGQGLGASLGGLTGGGLGGFVGGNLGFGLSLLGTGLGSVFDQLSQAAQDTGKALNSPIESFDKLKEAAIFASDEQEYHISKLIESGRTAEATAQIQAEVIKKIGVTGVNDLMRLGDASSDLSDAWAEFNLQLQAALAGPMAGLLEWVTSIVKIQNESFRSEQLVKDVSSGLTGKTREKFLNEILAIDLKESRPIGGISKSEASKQRAALAEFYKSLANMPQAKKTNEFDQKREDKLRTLGEQLLGAIDTRAEAIVEARKQKEEEIAAIRERAIEQAAQLEEKLADSRRDMEREIARIRLERADESEDIQRRIRIARGENPDLVRAEQEIADIYRKGRDQRAELEQRLADDERNQAREIADFQKGVAKELQNADAAHNKRMGEIQKEYARTTAKIMEEGSGKAAKRVTEAYELLKYRLLRESLQEQRMAAAQAAGGTLPVIPSPTPGAPITNQSYLGIPPDEVPERFIEIDKNIRRLNQGLQSSTQSPSAARLTASLIEGAMLPSNLNFDVSKLGTDFGTVASASFMQGILPVQQLAQARPIQAIPFSQQTTLNTPSLRQEAGRTTRTREQLRRTGTNAIRAAELDQIVASFAEVNLGAAQYSNSLKEQISLIQKQISFAGVFRTPEQAREVGQLDIRYEQARLELQRKTEQARKGGRLSEEQLNLLQEDTLALLTRTYHENVKLTLEYEKQADALAFIQEKISLQRQIAVTGAGAQAGFFGQSASAYESELLKGRTPAQAREAAGLTRTLERGQTISGMQSELNSLRDPFNMAVAGGNALGQAVGAIPSQIFSGAVQSLQQRGQIEEEISRLERLKSSVDSNSEAYYEYERRIAAARGELQGIATTADLVKNAFQSMLQSIAQALLDQAAKMIATYIAIGIAKAFAFGGNKSESGLNFDDIKKYSTFANGAAFGSGGVQAFANGGTFTNSIVSSPTLFQFADGGVMKMGVMGEAGDEAVMPLERDSNGRLGVRASGLADALAATRNAISSTTTEVSSAAFEENRMALNEASSVERERAVERVLASGAGSTEIKYSRVGSGDLPFVTEEDMLQATRAAAEQGAKLGQQRTIAALRNNPGTRRSVGV